MNGRMYTITFDASVSGSVDIEFRPADEKPIEIVGLAIAQKGVADVGDAAEELIAWSIIRGFTSSGSGGSTPTPAPVKRGNTVAAGFVAETLNTTLATTGTTVTLHRDAFNVRVGMKEWWPEGTEPDCTQTDTSIVIRLDAPADPITLVGTVYVREIGG